MPNPSIGIWQLNWNHYKMVEILQVYMHVVSQHPLPPPPPPHSNGSTLGRGRGVWFVLWRQMAMFKCWSGSSGHTSFYCYLVCCNHNLSLICDGQTWQSEKSITRTQKNNQKKSSFPSYLHTPFSTCWICVFQVGRIFNILSEKYQVLLRVF